MGQNNNSIATTLELLVINQTALRAAIEELSLWVSQRGSTQAHDNVMSALKTLDQNAETISTTIRQLQT